MESLLVFLYSLISTSALLCVALAVAWRLFGRELHAALWSLAYGLSAANWTANLLMVWLKPGDMVLTMICAICSVGSFSLIALGFRCRAGLPFRRDAILAAAGITILFVGGAILSPLGINAQRWIVLFFCAAMLIVSARTLRTAPAERRKTGGVAFWALVLFASYVIGLGIIAAFIPDSGAGQAKMAMLFRVVAMMGVPTGLFGVGLFAMFLLAADLAEGMRLLASSDPLTGILNRRGFEQAAVPMFAHCQRHGRAIAVVIADLDRFKAVNDRFGHNVGDAILTRFVTHAQSKIRQADLFGRLGGEEFVFVLPDTDGPAAMLAIERVRVDFARTVSDLVPAGTTVSFGIATLDEPGETLADLMQRADQALYRSKIDGRDRVTIAVSIEVMDELPFPAIDGTVQPRRQAAA